MVLRSIPWQMLCLSLFNSFAYAQSFKSSNLPIIVINTKQDAIIVDEPKTEAIMGIIHRGPGVLNQTSDSFNDFYGDVGIELRGSTSMNYPKSQYGIEIRDNVGRGRAASLLGLPAEEDWVLFAPYNDKSLMRDVLAYRIARDMGRYAPRTRYAELILNGTYMGVYVLIEKIKRDDERVDISKLEPAEVSGDDLTGGYILKIDKFSGNKAAGFWSTYLPPNRGRTQGIYFQFEYPKTENLAAEQKTYIQNFVSAFEDALHGEGFTHPENGYRKYADVSSFVDYMIVSEVSKNVDAYRISTFFHKDKDSKGGKIQMGPVWDFNLGFGNVSYCTSGEPESFVHPFNYICPNDPWLAPFWWERLLQDPTYVRDLGNRWKGLRDGALRTDKVHAFIDSVATILNEGPQQRNFERWPVLGVYIYPNAFVGTSFSQEVNWLKDWINARLNWLDSQWGNFATEVETPALNSVDISVYPNPTSTDWIISYVVKTSGDIEFTVSDLTGKIIYSDTAENVTPGYHEKVISSEKFSNSFYLLKIRSANSHTVVRKIVKGG